MNGALGMLSVGVNVDLRSYNTSMDQVEQRAGRAAQSINSLGSSLGQGAAMGAGFAVATAALTALTSAAGGAVGAVVQLSSQLEQAQIGFTAFTGSAQKAGDFVKQLQDFAAHTTFEFPSLLQASRQLMGMGVQAELVIPIMKDVGAAVMAVGGTDVEIRRVNTALTQMMAAGKVNAQDMNQLAQAGIPAWKMLADSMGMSIGQVRELSKQGQITAAQMLQAFHNFVQNNNLDTMLESANKTWAAASSNFIDGLRNMATEGFAPLFAVARDGLVAVADQLTSIDAKNFAQDLKATTQDIVSSFAPVGEAISRAFEAFKTGGPTAAFNSLLQSAQQLAQSMFGAGVNVVETFASGIIQGASTVITQAANFVADIISSYLIGQSPPPVGPLSQIVQGGANVIASYVEGMKGGLAGVTDVAQGVADAFGNVGKTMTLSEGFGGFKQAGTDLKALQGELDNVEGVLRNLDGMVKDNANTVKDYQNAVTDIKSAYEGAIDPLQKQVDALKEVNDLAQKQADIQDRIALANLKGQLSKAQGDPVARARLQEQLELLSEQEKSLSLQESQMRLSQQQADLAAKAKGKKPDTGADSAAKQRENQLAQQRLGIQQQQNAIQQQLNGMVDKEAVARIKAQQTIVQAGKDQRDLNQDISQLNRELQAAPLEQQIKDLKAQEQALLEPIQERITQYQREGQALTAQRQQWQELKASITDVMQEQRRLAEETKKAQKEALDESKKNALANPLDLTKIFDPQAITAQATKVGESWLTGFKDYINNNAANIIGGAIGGVLGGAVFGPLGAVAGAAFGAQFATRLLGNLGSMENIGGLIAGKISDALNIDTGGANNSLEAFAIIFETLRDRATTALETLRTNTISKLGEIQTSLGGVQKWWQETFGSDTLGAQAGIAAIEGINKTVQALQLLLEGNFKGALETAKGALADFGVAGSDAVLAVQTKYDELVTKIQPAIDEIKAQWKSVVDTVNSAEFKDNISVILKNLSLVLQFVTNDLDKTKISLDNLNNTKMDGTKFVDLGAALQSVVHDVALMTTAFINLMDVFGTLDSITSKMVRELGLVALAIKQVGLMIKDVATGDWEKAQEDFNIFTGLDKDLTKAQGEIQASWTDLIARIKARADEANKAGQSVGQAASQGAAQGVEQAQPQVDAAITKTADDLHSKFAERMQSRSPSLVMVEEGTFIGAGLAQGITDSSALVFAAITTEIDAILILYQTGWMAVHEQTTLQLDEIYALLVQKSADSVGVIQLEMDDMLAVTTAGMSAIHAGMTTQLDEIYALLVLKSTDMTGAVTNMMASMLVVITSETEKWQAAGLALGTALAEGIASAQLAVNRSSMQLMGNVTGGSKANPALQASINAAAGRHGLDPALFTAQLQHESAGFDPNVLTGARRGGSGEVGIGQFMEATLLPRLQKAGLTLQQYLSDVNIQIEESAKFMEELVSQYGTIDKALQAYNGGPGGVGSAATTRYSNIIHEIASQLQTSSAGNGMTMMSAATGAGGVNLGLNQIKLGAQAGLSVDEAMAACGPYAATMFMQAVGRPPNLAEATQLAAKVGWTAARGMGGTGNFMALLSRMGLNAVQQAPTATNINAATAAGNPFAISTPKHYFAGQGGTAEGGLNVGLTGTVMGGKPIMTLAEIQALGGGLNDLIVLVGTLNKTGTETFTNLTHVSGQMGPAVQEDVQANTALAASSQTLAQTIQSGVVPAGLAARDAVGAMAIGVQPLISQFANGQITTDQLGQALVTLASTTGLTTAPLAAMQAGTLSTNAALRQVLDSLMASDPAFAQIQQSFDSTAQESGALANTLLQGLSNVTGLVSPSLQQMASAAQPLSAAFASGAISSEQFVQGVVGLAASSGLTQVPLRAMQDGLLTSNEALAAVVTQVAAADPALASMSTSIADSAAPATDAATAFLTWVDSMAQTQQAATDANQSIEQVPQAVEGIQQPVEQASQTTMQVLPEQTTIAVDASIEAIRSKTGDAAAAATEVGNAVVEALVTAVTEGASRIADAAMAVIQDALDAAKKAAEAATANLGSKTEGGGSSKKKTKTDTKATGGPLSPGVWTLVGEYGPELISPDGYVYTAAETLNMVNQGVTSGLMDLERFASGGSSKAKSSSSSKSSSSKKSKSSKPKETETAPKKQQTEPYLEEVNLSEQLLKLTQERDKLLVEMQPIEEKIRKEEEALAAAQKGSLAIQLQLLNNKKVTAEIDSQIYHLTYDEGPLHTSTYKIQLALNEAKRKQEEASKGDLSTQLKLNGLETQKLINNAQIAKLQEQSLPLRQQVADVEQQIAELQKGSLSDQLKSAALNAEKNKNLLAENALQIKAAPLRAQVASAEKEVNKILAGTLEQRQTIARNEQQIAQITQTELQTQKQMLPVQSAIRDVQKEIDRIQSGTIDVQKTAVDLSVKQAQLRLQEIDAQGQLRDVEAGTLNLNQEEINALHRKLEILDAQKADLSDQSETQQLIGTIASADARKRLIDLNAQASIFQDTLDTTGDQKGILQNQNDLIRTGNTVSAAGAQTKLADLQEQLGVYEEQIAGIEAQNSVLDLQLQGIQLQNQIRADGLQGELLTLQNQLGVYDQQIAKVQQQNDVLTAQAAVITANNAVAAAGYNSQIILMQNILSARQLEIDKLTEQKNLIAAQTTEINNQNTIAAAGHQAQIIQLEAQEATQQSILGDLNAQIGALNAQKKIYQDIRDLADAIANRPVAPRPAPGGTTGGGGPPGTVSATATKAGAETLYLSRGTGTDGWYTGAGQLVVQGGTSNPPSGYKVKYLADGGLLRAGEMAIVGERGPEPIIAARDLVVFPHEMQGGVSSAWGRAMIGGVGGSGNDGSNVTVNVEYHRHGGSDYGEATVAQVVREAVQVALRQ